jgi:hypothetical protein
MAAGLFAYLFGAGGAMAETRLTTGNEILARQRAAAAQAIYNEHLGQLAQAQVRDQAAQGAQQGALSVGLGQAHRALVINEAAAIPQGVFGRLLNTGAGYNPNMFTRWLDIRESEDELQEFLSKCVAYGAKMQRPTTMSVEELEK